ncbi:antitoxin [Nonomuraea sp. NPDC005983]|uniref:antitoxin n=1 Tax=Nonomuraea sp. NPDC005983 TaxID=3155595 RepID=UPI0033A13F65
MSILDKVKEMFGGKAGEAAREGIDRAAQAAKSATGGKYDEQIDKGADMAREKLDDLDRKEEDR